MISSGNTLAKVPTDLKGRSQQRAVAALKARGLTPIVQTQHDESVPAGQAIAVAPGTPTRLPKGRSVTLLVSDGPQPRVVPADLVGLPEAEARAKLAATQLVAGASTTKFDDNIAAGRVISSLPAVGASVPRDSTVALVVSKGPDLVTVPSVRSAGSLDGAISLLRRAGLSAGNVSGPATGRPRRTIPSAGQRVARGRSVDITLG